MAEDRKTKAPARAKEAVDVKVDERAIKLQQAGAVMVRTAKLGLPKTCFIENGVYVTGDGRWLVRFLVDRAESAKKTAGTPWQLVALDVKGEGERAKVTRRPKGYYRTYEVALRAIDEGVTA
jgi:hypothetical protein